MSNMRNTRLYHIFVCTFLKRNTDNHPLIYLVLPNRSPMLKQRKIFLSKNTSRRYNFIIHASNSEKFLHKN